MTTNNKGSRKEHVANRIMLLALAALKDGVSVNNAVRRCNIPKTTLRSRVSGKLKP